MEFRRLLRKAHHAKAIHRQMAISLEALMPALLDQAFRQEL